MTRIFFMMISIAIYALFLATFLYLIGFLANLVYLPTTVDRAGTADLPAALLINLGLIAVFGVQHSVMARQGFKRAWTKWVPVPLERSGFVFFSSVALIILFLFWQAVPVTVWKVENAIGAAVLWGLFALGWGIVLLSTFLINHFELFGLQQAYFPARERAASAPQLREPLFYKLVRHPLYSGFFLAFWATPHMTAGHLLFASAMSAYMLIGIRFEERDLIAYFGKEYERYRDRVGMLVPRLGRNAT